MATPTILLKKQHCFRRMLRPACTAAAATASSSTSTATPPVSPASSQFPSPYTSPIKHRLNRTRSPSPSLLFNGRLVASRRSGSVSSLADMEGQRPEVFPRHSRNLGQSCTRINDSSSIPSSNTIFGSLEHRTLSVECLQWPMNERRGRSRRKNGHQREYSGGGLGLLLGATTFMATSSKTSDEDKDEEKKSERQERKAEFSQLNCKGIRLQNETNMSAQKVDREVKVKRKKRVMSVEKVGEIERDVHDTEWEEGDGIIVEVSYTEEEEEEEKEEAKVENLSNNRSLKAEEAKVSNAEYAHTQNNNSDTNNDTEKALVKPFKVSEVANAPETNDNDDNNDDNKDGDDDNSDDDEEEDGKKEKKKEKQRIGFRDRKIIDYENRIRNYSTPDKIFRYFATYKSILSDNEIYMTPGDFLRSLTPGVKQPDGLGLDQFRKFDPTSSASNVTKMTDGLNEDSIFYQLGNSGLISFSDYIFLLTILSTSRRQFEIAFRMFDLNGDGDVDAEEFEKVQEIIRQTSTTGKKHRDHGNTGSTIKKMNSALANYFFGENMDGKLTIERFLEFQSQLQSEILTLEFQRKDPDEANHITEKQFAELLLTYADYSPKKRSVVLKRVKKAYKNTEETQFPGISLEEYIKIFHLLMHIEDVDKALYFYHLAGASIDQNTLKHVAKVCADVDLGDHVVDVIFTIFDEDGDGALSNKEFVAVMKNKLKRGLEKPKDTGLFTLFAAVTKCALTTK